MTLLFMTACGSQEGSSGQASFGQELQGQTSTVQESSEQPPSGEEKTVIKVASLKGPTSMGLVKMMKDNDGSYDFQIYTAADEIVPLIVGGKVQIASIPANLAAVLYQKTDGKIAVLDVNTLGVLYVVSFDKDLQSVENLKGKTIYMTGKGTTPEYAFRYVLSLHGMSDSDVKMEFKSEATEVISAMQSDPAAIAVLPQPFVTTALAKLEGAQLNISLADEWKDLLTGVTVVDRTFLETYPDAVEQFMADQKASVAYVNENVEEMSAAIEEYDIVKAAVAKQAIPYCNLVFIDGSEMKSKLQNYLEALYEQDASSVGGKLPGDDFYYHGK